ncbi:SEFIR domain-containing protein [Pseudomonas viridiflava]|uniref:SEFIR domain-containing protein n=1 Tax=Pseudomonas viridiflava TaxID=33069 RepID=UPI00073179A5|nr:SEFIR domain-containing protein [Pseudomonas viridiflava]KTC15368.1 hypothetical protein AO390_02655 [Pseudomonas marginalis ICMP 11289]
MQPTKIFISYSWDSEEHQNWVKGLATDLDEYKDFHVTFDQFDLDNFADKNLFMEKAVQDADIIIIVCTEIYKRKAESRTGGVGIETYLSVIRHWEDSEGGAPSNILVVSREKYSTPFYLRGKFRVDFHDDDLYQKSLSFLIKALSKNTKAKRPDKKKSVESGSAHYDFTRVEDILRLKNSKREALISTAEGTDYSTNNRVKFELWEVSNPFKSHFLILYPNITISQTINRFCKVVAEKGIKLTNIILLRPAKGDETLVRRIMLSNNLSVELVELTYSEYVWEYCIDERLRASPIVRENKFYTDQALGHFSTLDSEGGKSDSAIDFLISQLMNENSSSGQLVVASGGMGKSTLCHQLAIALNKKFAGASSVVLIKAESLRNNFSSDFIANIEIRSLYDLYDLHAQVNNIEEVYDRNQFELCLLCGRLVIIIDGLDEFASILQERFALADFLISIYDSHQQMGRSQVILTSRNMAFTEEVALDGVGIQTHELLGFDEASRAKYIRKRFSKYDKADELIALFDKYLEQLEQFGDPNKRIVPFFIDMISTIFEEQLEANDKISFEISSEDRDYACNSSLTDLIIFSVLRREKTRHDIELETKEFIELFSELAVEHGDSIPCEKLREKLNIYYDDTADKLYSKVVISPLLVQEGNILRFRYQFLNEYFKSLYVISGILRSSVSKDMVQCLAGIKDEDQQSIADVILYFSHQDADILHDSVKVMIGKAKGLLSREGIEPRESESVKKAVGSLLNIHSRCGRFQRKELSRRVRDLFQISPDLDTHARIDGLYLYGDYPSLDFSNLHVWDSGFYNYENFITSTFSGAKFFYSEFTNTGGAYASDTFNTEMFDSTCRLGDLTDTLALVESSAKSTKALCESELKKFLRSFFKGTNFVDQKTVYMQFSGKVEKLGRRNFDALLKKGLVQLETVKTIDKFYVIAEPYQDSVHRFLNDNFIDGKMKELVAYLMS